MTAPAFEPAEAEELTRYLTGLYRGVFTSEAIRTHLDAHVGFGFADYAVAVSVPFLRPGARVLDLGCGFGSYVLRARAAGADAVGVELAAFEIEFARRRSRRLRPQDDADEVYQIGDATKLDTERYSFDAVTLWNVLEHIEDAEALLRSADRLLKRDGQFFIVCPNYEATRDEAHYHVPWNAELSHDRARAAAYLKSLGRDPTYFETSIHCRTNREVISILERLGYDLFELSSRRPMSYRLRNIATIVMNHGAVRAARSRDKHSVEIAAAKGGTR